MTTTLDDLKAEIKQAIVRSLRLPIAPEAHASGEDMAEERSAA